MPQKKKSRMFGKLVTKESLGQPIVYINNQK